MIETKARLNASFQGIKRLFVLVFNGTTVNDDINLTNNTNNRVERDSHQKYFLPRVNISNYNILINDRNVYDPPTGDQFKNYDEISRCATRNFWGQGRFSEIRTL